MDKNREAYTKVLNRGNEKQSKDDKREIFIEKEIENKFREIKKYMEWGSEISINAALTLFFKLHDYNDNKVLEKIEYEYKKYFINEDSYIKVSFSTSIKNENRISELSNQDVRYLSYLALLGIKELYGKLMGDVKNE